MGFFSRLFGKDEELGIPTEQIKTKIYKCLSEGKAPEQVIEDARLTGWKLLNSKSDALSYIKYIHGRMERQRTYDDIGGRRSGFDRRLSADSNYQGIEKRISGDRRKGTRKREQTRFRTKDLTFVKLNSENKDDIGELLDISKGGLSLRYFVKEEKPRNYLDLSILSSGGDLIMDKVSFRTVSHTELVHNIPFSSIIFKRYGVQFEKLTPEQTTRLDYCLLNHTLSEA